MLSSVLLPQPDGPTTDTKTWPDSSRLRAEIARTGGRPFPVGGNTLVSSSILSVATLPPLSRAALERLARIGAPAEGPPGDALEHEPVEQHDEHDEEQDPGHEARELVRVVPRAGLVADAVAAAEPLGQQDRVPAHDHREAEAGEDVVHHRRQHEVADPLLPRDAERL